MVELKTWKDNYYFLKEFAVCSCLNCHYGGMNVDENKEYDDSYYARVFCKHSIGMIRLDLLSLCSEWVNDNGETLNDYGDATMWKLTDDEIDKIESATGRLSIEDIRSIVGEK